MGIAFEAQLDALADAVRGSDQSRTMRCLADLARAGAWEDLDSSLEVAEDLVRAGMVRPAREWADFALSQSLRQPGSREHADVYWTLATIAWLEARFADAAYYYSQIGARSAKGLRKVAIVCDAISAGRERRSSRFESTLREADVESGDVHFVRFAAAVLPVAWGSITPAAASAVVLDSFANDPEPADIAYMEQAAALAGRQLALERPSESGAIVEYDDASRRARVLIDLVESVRPGKVIGVRERRSTPSDDYLGQAA